MKCQKSNKKEINKINDQNKNVAEPKFALGQSKF